MSDEIPFADDKDWTWVLEQVCAECRFDVRTFDREDVGQMIRDNAAQWQEILAGDVTQIRERPRADRWSTLEYACHVRDVFELYHQRLELMLAEDGPRYANWDQDTTAVEKNYGSAEPELVGLELTEQAARLADLFDTVEGAQWDRTGYRSDGAAFTVHSFARYLIHDPIHHLWDVTQTQ